MDIYIGIYIYIYTVYIYALEKIKQHAKGLIS